MQCTVNTVMMNTVTQEQQKYYLRSCCIVALSKHENAEDKNVDLNKRGREGQQHDPLMPHSSRIEPCMR